MFGKTDALIFNAYKYVLTKTRGRHKKEISVAVQVIERPLYKRQTKVWNNAYPL